MALVSITLNYLYDLSLTYISLTKAIHKKRKYEKVSSCFKMKGHNLSINPYNINRRRQSCHQKENINFLQ